MSDQLSAAAQGMGVPEELVMRSARARAAAAGADVDAILAAWAGGEAAPAAAEPEPATEPAPVAATEPEPEPTPQPEAPEPAPAAEVPGAAPAPTPVPVPATVTPEEALDYDVVVSVPTAGLKERTSTTIPQWLVAALLIVPLFGLLYLAGNGTADATCEEGGVSLRVDRATGVLENCDGSVFEGRGGASGGSAQFIALGSDLYTTCAGCHGANGGGGTGPAFGGVLNTFGSCTDHIEWVRLGSAGFQAAGRNTYGDLGTTIGGGMPGFPNLTDEEIAAVVSFERIRFGGGNPDEVLTNCGLLEPEGEETPEDGTTDTTMPEG
ncbi:MAG TPA: c-type cytochrome [Candidatus Sulfomarinibacteraceae bacterium]|nr:c-type cytochrome [Candidatus Sulfomarinibacteraceae bacterium]